MTTKDIKPINRTGLFIISFQLEGLCTALRHCLACNLTPGPASVGLVQKLFDEFREISTGRWAERFPEISESLLPSDLLAIAETLRMTVVSFLSPQETEDRAQIVGFSNKSG